MARLGTGHRDRTARADDQRRLTLSAAGSITYGSSAATLSSTGGGAITLQAGVGSGTGSVTVGAAITTSGPVTLSSGNSGGLVTISEPVAAALSVAGVSGIVIGSGVGTIQSSAGQTCSGAVTIASGTTTLSDSGGGTITFGGTIDGAGTLVTSTGGAATFEGVVGGTTALGALSVQGPATFDIPNAATIAAGFSVRTDGSYFNFNSGPLQGFTAEQGYAGAVTLETDTVLTTSSLGRHRVRRYDRCRFARRGQPDLEWQRCIRSSRRRHQSAVEAGPAGHKFTDIFASITTAGGGREYGDSELEILGTVSLSDVGGGNIVFGPPTLFLFGNGDTSGNLNVSTSGTTIFGGTMEAFGTVTVASTGGTTILAAEPIVISPGSPLLGINVYGSLYFDNPVYLANNTLIGGGSVSFASTVDSLGSPVSLPTVTNDVNGKSSVSFAGAVGGRTPLAGLSVTGTTTLGATVNTVGGGQSIAVPVTIASGTTTLIDSGGGAVTFGGTIDGAGTLIPSTSGVTTFDGIIGGTTALDAPLDRGAGVL